jgi:HEAT repeat protein
MNIQPTISMDELFSLLRNQEIDVRWRAASLLSSCGAAAVEPLLKHLYDDDQNIRILSIWALGRIGDPRAVGPISRSLHDDDSFVRMACEGALSRLIQRREF